MRNSSAFIPFLELVIFFQLLFISSVSASASNKSIGTLQKNYITNLQQELASRSTGQCRYETMTVRKPWSRISDAERKEYLAAVACLYKSPNKISRSICPGARNRYDDFTYGHINQTNFVHGSGLFLPWHRQFTWAHENIIRTECGYTGGVPYWDWENYPSQSQSPIFDGSKTSFGGNGKDLHRTGVIYAPLVDVPLTVNTSYGTGGGCVQNLGGLPANFTVNIGPVSPANNSANNKWGYDYNPRCLKRDFLESAAESGLSIANATTLLNMQDIHTFHPFMEPLVHPKAHSFIGGDAFDFYSSPSDPVFYLLHSQIDRLWTIWQGQDFAERTNGLDGTVTFENDPPSANATLDTVMHMLEAGGDMPIARVMSTFDNSYCYRYE